MARVRVEVVEKDGQAQIREIHRVVVHRFQLGDVEDPEIYAAEPIWQWQQTEMGKFIMENAEDPPVWHRRTDMRLWGYDFAITAELESKKLAEFYLRWGKNGNDQTF